MFITVRDVLDVYDYRPWGGAVSRWDEVWKAGKAHDLWALMADLFDGCDTVTTTTINDFVWFEEDYYRPILGMPVEE